MSTEKNGLDKELQMILLSVFHTHCILVLVRCFAHTYCSLNRAYSVINLHQGANDSGPVTPTRSPWIQTSIASVCKCMFHNI